MDEVVSIEELDGVSIAISEILQKYPDLRVFARANLHGETTYWEFGCWRAELSRSAKKFSLYYTDFLIVVIKLRVVQYWYAHDVITIVLREAIRQSGVQDFDEENPPHPAEAVGAAR